MTIFANDVFMALFNAKSSIMPKTTIKKLLALFSNSQDINLCLSAFTITRSLLLKIKGAKNSEVVKSAIKDAKNQKGGEKQ